MKIKQLLGAWLFVCSAAMPAFGQQYQYQLQVKDVGAVKKIFFGYWYGAQAFLMDSATIDQANNQVLFKGNKKLDPGQYFFASDQSAQTLDFIVNGENNLQFYTPGNTAWADSFQVVKSKENTPFFVWRQYKAERENKIASARSLLDMLKKATKDRSVLEEQSRAIRKMREEIDSFSRAQRVKYPNLLFAKIVAADAPPAIPPTLSPIDKTGQVNPAYMQYFRDHFWDGYDFTDERLLHSPVLARKADDWMQVQSKNLDSVKIQMSLSLKKASVNKKTHQMLLQFFTERLDKPSYGGNESMLVYLFDHHYPSATAAGIDTATWMRLEYKANAYRPTLPGMTAPSLILQDTAGNQVSLHDFQANFTLVYFFNPLCSHCVEYTPDVYRLTLPYAEKGIKVFAVSTETTPDVWKQYVRTNVPQWTCVADFSENSPIEKTYATHSLPNILVLDKDKKVVIRRLPVPELPNVLKALGGG